MFPAARVSLSNLPRDNNFGLYFRPGGRESPSLPREEKVWMRPAGPFRARGEKWILMPLPGGRLAGAARVLAKYLRGGGGRVTIDRERSPMGGGVEGWF